MNWSYIAGYFDGEGHVEKRSYGIGWSNSHLASLEAIQAFIGHGTIEAKPGTHKPVYDLRIRNLTALREVVPQLIRRCIVKRGELEHLLDRTKAVTAVPNYGLLARTGADTIKNLYWTEELSCAEIAAKYGVHPVSIDQFLRNHGGLRTQQEAMAVAGRRGKRRGRYSNGGFPMEGVNPSEVRAAYWDEGLSTREIGLRYGLTREGMRAYMTRHGIPFRPRNYRAA